MNKITIALISFTVLKLFAPFNLQINGTRESSKPNESRPDKSSNQTKPNIILIMADDMGYETLGCNGGLSYNTPVLNRMANQGIRFKHCYSQPLSTPSRVKIMTGKYNFRNYEHFEYLSPNQITFGNILKEAGYETAIAGKWQLNGIHRGIPGNQDINRAYKFGFDEYCLWQIHKLPKDGERYANPLIYRNGDKVSDLENSYGPDVFSEFIIDFIDRKSESPFFVYYPMVLPHSPFVPTPNSPQWSNKLNRYKQNNVFFKDMVEYVDKIVGRIEYKLKEKGIWENTVIIFVADNGTNKRITSSTKYGDIQGGKGSTLNSGNHVPLIVQWPAVIEQPKVCKRLVSFADFIPTLADIVGENIASLDTDGKSFFSAIKGTSESIQDEIFIHYTPRWGNAKHDRWVMDGTYKIYQDSTFYKTSSDPNENFPLKNLNNHEKLIRKKLIKTLIEKEKEFPFHWNNEAYAPSF